MKLDIFLQQPSFSKYKQEVQGFQSEFISEGCELFLWPHDAEERAAVKYTESLAQTKGTIKTNPQIAEFIEKIKPRNKRFISFIFPEDFSPKYLIAKEIAKNAKECRIIDNIFPEDDTNNWIATFDPADKKNIGMMNHVVYSKKTFFGDNFGGYKLFGQGLIYYAKCLQHDGHLLRMGWPNPLVHFQGNLFRVDTDPGIIFEVRKVSKMLVRLGYFEDEYEFFYNLWYVLLPHLQKMYERAERSLKRQNHDWKNDVKELQSQMIADGKIASKWKSEQTLFTMVKKEYPDAIFQFRPRWLEPQSLDIYIPCLRLGIEYQGKQHYESVDFFGGEEALQHRKELDAHKAELCVQNGLKLIAWPYTDKISLKTLKAKIADALNK